MILLFPGKIKSGGGILRIKKLAAAAVFALILFTPVSAAGRPNCQPVTKGKDIRLEHREKGFKERDPVKALEAKKEIIRKLVKEGKISKEKAEEIIRKLDAKIEKIKEFQSLPLEEKRKRLINDFTEKLDRMVKEGKISRQEADKMLKEITEKINKWDGSGLPKRLMEIRPRCRGRE